LEASKQQSNNIVTHNEKLYVIALSLEKGNDHIWYVDREATSHMSHDIGLLKTYEKSSNNQVMYLGNNIRHQIFGQGDVFIKLKNGQIKDIPNVLHVSDFKKNLFFAKQLDSVGCEIVIKKG